MSATRWEYFPRRWCKGSENDMMGPPWHCGPCSRNCGASLLLASRENAHVLASANRHTLRSWSKSNPVHAEPMPTHSSAHAGTSALAKLLTSTMSPALVVPRVPASGAKWKSAFSMHWRVVLVLVLEDTDDAVDVDVLEPELVLVVESEAVEVDELLAEDAVVDVVVDDEAEELVAVLLDDAVLADDDVRERLLVDVDVVDGGSLHVAFFRNQTPPAARQRASPLVRVEVAVVGVCVVVVAVASTRGAGRLHRCLWTSHWPPSFSMHRLIFQLCDMSHACAFVSHTPQSSWHCAASALPPPTPPAFAARYAK